MKYSAYVIVGLTIIIIFYLKVFSREQPTSNLQTKPTESTIQGVWETKTDNQPPVTIEVTPIELSKNSENWKFKLTLDTHSGSLDDNLLTVVSLEDDKGYPYQPIKWEGPDPGGHHIEGTLIFNPINPVPSYIELKIKNVGGILSRSFTWSVQ